MVLFCQSLTDVRGGTPGGKASFQDEWLLTIHQEVHHNENYQDGEELAEIDQALSLNQNVEEPNNTDSNEQNEDE